MKRSRFGRGAKWRGRGGERKVKGRTSFAEGRPRIERSVNEKENKRQEGWRSRLGRGIKWCEQGEGKVKGRRGSRFSSGFLRCAGRQIILDNTSRHFH